MENLQMNRTIIKVITPLLITLAMITGKATASTVIYDLELNNLAAYTGQTLARVTLTDHLSGGVDFEVEALITGTKVAQFGFNFMSNTVPVGFSITGLPSAWVYDVAIDSQEGFNGFGKFDVDVHDGGSAGRLSPLTFSVSTGSVADYVALSSGGSEPSLFSIHVTDLDASGSGFCDGSGCDVITGYAGGGTLVPVPAAVWLFGSGLLGLVGIGRRRKI
jgi:hypothetical protein